MQKGDIRVAGSIDRETLSFYRLVVVAKDGATGSFQRTVSRHGSLNDWTINL